MESHSLYNFEALFSPGMINIANNCYASNVFLYLLNHPVIQSILGEIIEEHRICEQYRKYSKTTYIIITTSVQ